jgi:hypothetical protein
MIASDALAGWLGCSTARAATEAAMRALAAELAAMPALAAIKRGLEPGREADADAVLALARDFVEDEAAIAAIVGAMVAAAAADPMCRPPRRASRNGVQDGLLLFSHPLLVIQLAAMSPDALAIERRAAGAPPISFTGQRTLFRFLRAGGAILSVWEAPLIDPGFTAAGSGRCRLRQRRRLVDGETIEFDGRREAVVVDRADADLVYMFASTSLEASPVGAEYDPRTLELVATSSTDDAASRTQMMLALLRATDRRDAAPLFAELLHARHFHARWQAMREFLALDAELALPHLRRMAAADPHPEVRAAAAETLGAFFEEPLASCHA